jgi:uncharacterized protein YbjT (DUF2867 family)
LDDLTRLAAEASSGGTLTSSGAGWGRFAPWTTTISATFVAAGRHPRASRSSAFHASRGDEPLFGRPPSIERSAEAFARHHHLHAP